MSVVYCSMAQLGFAHLKSSRSSMGMGVFLQFIISRLLCLFRGFRLFIGVFAMPR